jgi:hypothetical protein
VYFTLYDKETETPYNTSIVPMNMYDESQPFLWFPTEWNNENISFNNALVPAGSNIILNPNLDIDDSYYNAASWDNKLTYNDTPNDPYNKYRLYFTLNDDFNKADLYVVYDFDLVFHITG